MIRSIPRLAARHRPSRDPVARGFALAALLLVLAQAVTAGLVVMLEYSWLAVHALGGKIGSALIAAAVITAWCRTKSHEARGAAFSLAFVYALQAVVLFVARTPELAWVKALHVPNSLLVFLFAWRLWQATGRTVSAGTDD